jgi:hypothetical protein
MFRWTDRKIRIHAFYGMLGISLLQHLHQQAQAAWDGISMEQLLEELRQIQQFVLLYPVWSRNSICMKSKDDGVRGLADPDRGVTPRYMREKSRRNVCKSAMMPLKSPDNISCFQRDRIFGPYGASRTCHFG